MGVVQLNMILLVGHLYCLTFHFIEDYKRLYVCLTDCLVPSYGHFLIFQYIVQDRKVHPYRLLHLALTYEQSSYNLADDKRSKLESAGKKWL